MINIIVAHNTEQAIGLKNKLLYKLPEDLSRFKKLTKNHVLVMGRKTYESLPTKPLKDRITIVLTSDPNYAINNPNIFCANSVKQTLDIFESIKSTIDNKEQKPFLWVCGGQKVYEDFICYSDEIHTTVVEDSKKGDSYFPLLNDHIWKVTFSALMKDGSYDTHYKIYSRL